MIYETEQENFWAGDFGNEYIGRNQGEHLINADVVLFGRILRSASRVKSIIELGCNVGLNLQALNRINNRFHLCGYEINKTAAHKAAELKIADIKNKTVLEKIVSLEKYDVSFTKGLLIHINPDSLNKVYENLYNISNRYIVVCEYYNPSPIVVEYRGNKEKLFKRDFAGELIDKYNLRLVDYGFIYHRDNYSPQDDLSWFLLEK